jgi:hypothetical protein
MPSRKPEETMPVEVFLEPVPTPMREIVDRLRVILKAATPEAAERVRLGWQILAYDLPIRKHGAYFAWIGAEKTHVHIGFPKGVLMDDPRGVLKGEGITKYARWLTYVPGAPIDADLVTELVLEAKHVAEIPKGLALELRRRRDEESD